MSINTESIESVISETEAEIKRLERALAALREAHAFLGTRAATSLSPRDGGKKLRQRGKKAAPAISENNPPGDLAGMTLAKLAEKILEQATEPEGLSADEITRRALLRGYRSTSFRNPANDPKIIATSMRVTLAKLDNFEVKNGKIRLKK